MVSSTAVIILLIINLSGGADQSTTGRSPGQPGAPPLRPSLSGSDNSTAAWDQSAKDEFRSVSKETS